MIRFLTTLADFVAFWILTVYVTWTALTATTDIDLRIWIEVILCSSYGLVAVMCTQRFILGWATTEVKRV